MTPDDEALIEGYVLELDDLPPSERKKAEALIESDDGAASLFAFLTMYHSEFGELGQSTPPQVEEWIRQLDPVPPNIPLHPAPPSFYHALPPVFASRHEHSGGGRPGTVLVSEAENVAAHVLIDGAGAHLRVHVLAPDREMSAHALLSLPGASIRIMLGADGRGSLDGLAGPAGLDLFGDASLYPARRYAAHTVDGLVDEHADLAPGFRLCIRLATGEARFVPAFATDLSNVRFVGVDSGTHRHVVETTEREAVVAFEEAIQKVTVAIYG